MTHPPNIITTTHTAKLEKLVRIRLDYSSQSNTIISIKITGDFFMHPEDALESLEAGLQGAKLNRGILQQRISSALDGAQCFGFDEESLAGAILDAETYHEI